MCPGGEGAVLKTVGCNGLHVRIVCTAFIVNIIIGQLYNGSTLVSRTSCVGSIPTWSVI